MDQDLHETVLRQLLGVVAHEGVQNRRKLAHMSHLLGKYRAELIKNHVIQQYGLQVQSGPFAGMRMLDRVVEGCFVPKLLGTYEAELHPVIESFQGGSHQQLLNIGCGEGYYAVGMARLLPQIRVYAYDQDSTAQTLCRTLAELNDVADRMNIGGSFAPADFAPFAGHRTLVICDVEGAEMELLDPKHAPALQQFDILVEMHDVFRQPVTDVLPSRFMETHDVQIIRHGGRDPSRFSALHELPHLDQWIAVWEWRSGSTPWAMMRARNPCQH